MSCRTKPDSCLGCALYDHGTDFSQVEGRCSLGVAIVAEASGEGEAREQLPLRPWAPSGAILERTLRRLSYSRDQFAVTNILRCRPRANLLDGMPYEQSAIRHCQPNLLAMLRQFRPKVIITLGNLPFRSITGISGKQRSISHLRGYVFRALPEFCAAAGDPNLVVVPTFHPAFLRRGAIHLTGVLARDIQRAVNIRAGKDTSFILDMPVDEFDPECMSAWLAQHNLRYQTHPTLRDLDLFCRDVKARSDAWQALSPDAQRASLLALSYDLETRESKDLDEDASDGFTDTQIQLVQFSIEPRSGIAMSWSDDFIRATRWLLKLPLPKVGHNVFLFDNRVLRAVGKRDFNNRDYFYPNGTINDTLQQFHFWQPDLPAHLQAASSFVQFEFPWKHLSGTNLPFYGVCDTDAALRVYQMMRKTMAERGIWDDPQPGRNALGYVNQVEALRPILADMEDRGFPVDDARRLALDAEFAQAQKESLAELDASFPNDIRKLHPKTGYKGVPPQVKPLLAAGQTPAEIATQVFYDSSDANGTPGDSYRYELRSFEDLVFDEQSRIIATAVERWCRVYQFSPNSSQQLLAYIKHKRHVVPTKKTGEDTTGKKELERLADKHKDNFYRKVIECRELGKMRGTFIEGFKPRKEDGRVHTTFTFDTATGQLSSRSPVNFQNVPKHGRLAKPIRSMFVDAGGKKVVEWDFKSYHVLTTGFEAKSKAYMRMARLDMHSFVAWHFLKLPGADGLFDLPDDELAAKLKWLKSDEKRKYVRDNQCKRAILGLGYGMGVRKLYDMNREYFENEGQARKLQQVIKALFPEVFRWQNQVRDLAHRQQYLRNRFGMIRWFYEVYSPDGRGGWKPGEQSEQAIAFLPASNAFGNIREAMKELQRRGLCEKWEMVNTVHDSLVFLVDPVQMDSHLTDVYDVLHAPSKVLIDPEMAPNGLVVDVEVSVGDNWGEMKAVEYP